MRVVLFLALTACGGGASITDGAGIATSTCDRLGPDGTGFLVESQIDVALDVDQAFIVEVEFPTDDEPVNRSDIYNCGSWSNTGTSGLDEGCERDAGQDDAERVGHSLAIEFPTPLTSPATVTVTAKVLSAPGATNTIATDDRNVSCR